MIGVHTKVVKILKNFMKPTKTFSCHSRDIIEEFMIVEGHDMHRTKGRDQKEFVQIGLECCVEVKIALVKSSTGRMLRV